MSSFSLKGELLSRDALCSGPAPSLRLLSTPGWSDPFAGSAISTSVGGGKGALLEGEGALVRGLPPGSWPPAREKEMGSA